MKPPRVRWNTTEARVERFVRLAQRLELPVFGFEVRGRDVTVLTYPREDGPPAPLTGPIPSSAGSATTHAKRTRRALRCGKSNEVERSILLIVRGNRASVSVGERGTMPASYDTIIVVRKRNARGEVVEYHTVGRKGPSIWRTGEPNPPGTPGYQAAYDAAIGVQAVLVPPATGHNWDTVDDLLDAYERSREFCRLAPRTRGRLPEGAGRRAGQVRQRPARNNQQCRAQGQRARLDRGALGREGR